MEHTPIPWRVWSPADTPGMIFSDASITAVANVIGIEGYYRELGRTEEETYANAAFIVQAVNAHQALVEALEWALKYIDNVGSCAPLEMMQAMHPDGITMPDAVAALKQARGDE